MSWCDKLAAVPSMGLLLQPHYVAGDAVLTALAPILDRFVEGDRPAITVSRHESFAVTFGANDGFQVGVEPNRIFVEFGHKIRMKAVSGGPPVAEMLSRPLPFTDLLPEVSKRLVEAALLLPSQKDRGVDRVGIIATAIVAPEETPPGITRFIDYIARPWSGKIDTFNVQIVGEIGETPTYRDRCVHHVIKTSTEENLLTIKFDWQRVFSSPQPFKENTLVSITSAAQKAALAYFEDLAEGNRFDENIISGSKGI